MSKEPPKLSLVASADEHKKKMVRDVLGCIIRDGNTRFVAVAFDGEGPPRLYRANASDYDEAYAAALLLRHATSDGDEYTHTPPTPSDDSGGGGGDDDPPDHGRLG